MITKTLLIIAGFCSVQFPKGASQEVVNEGMYYSGQCMSDLQECAEVKPVKDCIGHYPKWGKDPLQGGGATKIGEVKTK